MSWLDIIPTCDQVFVYQAALVCEDCANDIMKILDEKGIKDDGDSDTYPQGPHGNGGGEADNCQFCDSGRYCMNAVKVGDHKVGCPLGNPLTSDGLVELQLLIADDMFSSKKFGRRIGRLLYHVWGEPIRGALFHPRTPLRALGDLPASLKKLVGRRELLPVLLCDPENAYLAARATRVRSLPAPPAAQPRGRAWEPSQGSHHDDSVHLLRAPVDEEGEFTTLDVAQVPPLAVDGQDLQKLLAQAVADGAWD